MSQRMKIEDEYPINIIDYVNKHLLMIGIDFIRDARQDDQSIYDIVRNNIDLRKGGDLKKIVDFYRNENRESALRRINKEAAASRGLAYLPKISVTTLGKQIATILEISAAEYNLPKIATVDGIMEYAQHTFKNNNLIMKRLAAEKKDHPTSHIFSNLFTGRVSVEPKDIELLSQSSLGQELNIVAQELSKELDIPAIDNVKSLLAYAQSIAASNQHYLITSRLMNAIEFLLPRGDDREGVSLKRPDSNNRYTPSLFSDVPDKNVMAIKNFYNLLLGRGNIEKEDLEKLSKGTVGDKIKSEAQALALKLEMPKIATVEGLILYIQEFQAPEKLTATYYPNV